MRWLGTLLWIRMRGFVCTRSWALCMIQPVLQLHIIGPGAFLSQMPTHSYFTARLLFLLLLPGRISWVDCKRGYTHPERSQCPVVVLSFCCHYLCNGLVLLLLALLISRHLSRRVIELPAERGNVCVVCREYVESSSSMRTTLQKLVKKGNGEYVFFGRIASR